MRNTTLLRPRERPQRTKAEIARWRAQRTEWFATLEPTLLSQRLFDHIPGVYFFAKDAEGHLMFASQGLLNRYQMKDDAEIIGRTDFDLNPGSMAQAYVDDDKHLLNGQAKLIERIELWWDRQGMPDWFLVTKLPILALNGRPKGVMGLLRRPDASERQLPVFQTVAQAVEIMRRDYSKPLLIEEIATACGQSVRQLQRRFQTAFAVTPQEFLLKTRVLSAARLLENSTASVSEVARSCGFIDQSAFTQHFRKRTGMTPTAYRQSQMHHAGKSTPTIP
jgi:AraC-like DNA-binding protein